MNRPITTLFMLMSVDGKISTGASDKLDVDKDFPCITGVKEGLYQYYELEQMTDYWSLNTGRVQAKLGVNEKNFPKKSVVSFVILDNTHLTEHGVRYLCAWSKTLVIITQNPRHPAFSVRESNLKIIKQDSLNLKEALKVLKEDYGCERLTIQSGGTVNGLFVRNKLIDVVDIVVAPLLIGGKETATLIDGDSITSVDELNLLGVLQLEKCEVLKDSYIRLRYHVTNNKR